MQGYIAGCLCLVCVCVHCLLLLIMEGESCTNTKLLNALSGSVSIKLLFCYINHMHTPNKNPAVDLWTVDLLVYCMVILLVS